MEYTVEQAKVVDGRAPTVSVIMGVFNAEKFVEEAIRSVLNQSFADFEFVVIDDGSTDNSATILRKLANQDTRIKLLVRAHRGLAATSNELLQLATGAFIAIMDHDDVMLPNCLRVCTDHLIANPATVAVAGNMDIMKTTGATLLRPRVHAGRIMIDTNVFPPRLPIISHPGSMARREAMLKIGGYRDTLPIAIDTDMWLRLGELGAIDQINDCVFRYRWHGGNATSKRAQENKACATIWQLSAVARHHKRNDDVIVAAYAANPNLEEAIAEYEKLLMPRFDAKAFAMLYNIRVTLSPLSNVCTDVRGLVTPALKYSLSKPFTKTKRTLLTYVVTRVAKYSIYLAARPALKWLVVSRRA